MFDNLRESAESPFYEEESNDLYKEPASRPLVSASVRRNDRRFLGMTGQQRFIVSLMLMFIVCILGTLALFITGRMSLF